MSLREQLLKSGLASKQQAKRADRESKKRHHQELSGKKQDIAEVLTKDELERVRLEELREADRGRNRLLEEERRLKEFHARAIDIMVHNDLSDSRGDLPYYFRFHDLKIGLIRVNEIQLLQLAQGQLAIASFEDFTRYFLVSSENAGKIQLCGPHFLLCFHDKAEAQNEA